MKQYEAAIALLKRYEQWEADIISANGLWWPQSAKDAFSGKMYDDMLELQAERNRVLMEFAEAPSPQGTQAGEQLYRKAQDGATAAMGAVYAPLIGWLEPLPQPVSATPPDDPFDPIGYIDSVAPYEDMAEEYKKGFDFAMAMFRDALATDSIIDFAAVCSKLELSELEYAASQYIGQDEFKLFTYPEKANAYKWIVGFIKAVSKEGLHTDSVSAKNAHTGASATPPAGDEWKDAFYKWRISRPESPTVLSSAEWLKDNVIEPLQAYLQAEREKAAALEAELQQLKNKEV